MSLSLSITERVKKLKQVFCSVVGIEKKTFIMGGLDFPELSLDLSNEHKPKTVSGLLQEVGKMRDICKKISKVENYVTKLEDEMKKIDAFRRELPLCMLLLNDAIERLKGEVIKCKDEKHRGEEEEVVMEKSGKVSSENDKKSWMSSVQLWNTDSSDHDLSSELKLGSDEEENSCVSASASKKCKSGNGGGEFMSFNLPGSEAKKVKGSKDVVVPISSLSLMSPVVQFGSKVVNLKNGSCVKGAGASGSSLFSDQTKSQSKLESSKQLHHQQQQQLVGRKQRRCWSAELHRRFVDALRQLGGSQVATPKQIREIMQVDGLTNDEVKSHLQKYRLHVRKVPSPSGNDNGLTMSQDDLPTKANNHQSSSPKGPLQTSASGKGVSTTYGDSMEEVEDEEFEGNSWKERVHN